MAINKRPISREEERLHRAVAQYLDAVLPEDAVWWHTPNGGWRSKPEAALLKALGTKAGIPDVLVAHKASLWALELKSGTGQVSVPQAVMHKKLAYAGCPTAICRSVDDVERTLSDWGFALRGRLAA